MPVASAGPTVALAGIDRFLTPWMGLTPYAAGQFTTFDLPAYMETVLSRGNGFALSYAAKQVTSSRSELGLRADRSFAVTRPYAGEGVARYSW